MAAHDPTVADLFGVSISLAVQTFTNVHLLFARMCDECVSLQITEDEQETELRGFIEHYEFPFVGA